jgi:SAM-dependent methyltransferase
MPEKSNPAEYRPEYFETLYRGGGLSPIDKFRNAVITREIRQRKQGGRVLDIGCGFGFMLDNFRGPGFTLCGTDLSVHAVDRARRRLPEGEFHAGDIHDGIPFAGTFDVILMINVIEHLQNPGAALAPGSRALNPGGLLAVHLPLVNNRIHWLLYDRLYADPTHIYRPSAAELNALITNCSFSVLVNAHAPFWPRRLWNALKPHPAFIGVYRKKG